MTFKETGDNSFESCAKLCDNEPKCKGFDFKTNKSSHPELFSSKPTFTKQDSCRLYEDNRPRYAVMEKEDLAIYASTGAAGGVLAAMRHPYANGREYCEKAESVA